LERLSLHFPISAEIRNTLASLTGSGEGAWAFVHDLADWRCRVLVRAAARQRM
jgi:hypothetical protein